MSNKKKISGEQQFSPAEIRAQARSLIDLLDEMREEAYRIFNSNEVTIRDKVLYLIMSTIKLMKIKEVISRLESFIRQWFF